LAITPLAIEHEELANRGQRRRVVRVIGLVAETIVHHRGVRHRREDAAEAILAVEAFGHKEDGFLDCPPSRIRREERLGDPQQPVEHSESHGQW